VKRLLPQAWRFWLWRAATGARNLRWLDDLSPRLYRLTVAWRARGASPDAREALASAAWPTFARREVLAALATYDDRNASGATVRADVVFASAPSPDLIKHAIGLRRTDPSLRLALVAYGLDHVPSLAHEWFDEIVLVDGPQELFATLRETEARVLILRTRSPLELLWAALYWSGRLVYVVPGFFLNSVARSFRQRVHGISYETGMLVERLLLARADGIVHFLADEAVDDLRAQGIVVAAPARVVYAGTMPELSPKERLPKLSAKDGAIHLVHATGVAPPSSDPDFGRYGQHYLKWPVLLEQGLHIHAYFSHISYDDSAWQVYFDLAERYPNFHMEEQLEFDQLLPALTAYDYALKHWDMRGRPIRPAHMQHLTTNFFAYLEAGLPMIVSPTMAQETDMVAERGIGLVIDEEALPRLGEILRSADLTVLRARVDEAAKAFAYDHEALWEVVLGT
jgi:hypothetical protein